MCFVVFEMDVVVDGVVNVASVLIVVGRGDVNVDKCYATENVVVIVKSRNKTSQENVM